MSKEKFIYFFTQAYNAEKTIARTIESVLAQSYLNIVYYIVDSASTDRTKEIILQYAGNDARIHPIFCKKNANWEIYNVLPMILEKDTEGYFAQIDADDTYASTFVEKLLVFMQMNELDIASCTSAYLDGITGEDKSKLSLQSEVIVEGEGFQDNFPVYFKYLRDSWGKLFSLKVLENLVYNEFDKNIRTGSVSFLCFNALLEAARIGIYPEQLHQYYIYPDSFERAEKNYERFLTPKLYENYYRFLLKKCGSITDANEQFLIKSYCNSICTKIKNFKIRAREPVEIERIASQIFECDFMHIVIEKGEGEQIRKLRNIAEDFLEVLSDKKVSIKQLEKFQEIRLQLLRKEEELNE